MLLEKWYADVVDENRVEVLYRANLKLGSVVFGYAGRITAGGRASASLVPGATELPREVDGSVVWPVYAASAEPALRWSNSQPREITLWRADRQLLSWNPIVLNGTVSGPGLSCAARGYVEKLTLNFGPWKLGLERLKWGRFCGRCRSLVWIQWEGLHPIQLAMVDGQSRQLREASRDHVDCAGATLRMTNRRPLVEERMAEGALRGLPVPRRLAAMRFFRGLESKWFALGVLELDGEAADSGHVIFEEVVWS